MMAKGALYSRLSGYFPILRIKPFQNRLTQQSPLVKITVLIDKFKLGSQFKGYLEVCLYQMLSLPDAIYHSPQS
jgi:hypothetical protein